MKDDRFKDTRFYADYDSYSESFCVFGDVSGFAYASYIDEEEAIEKAKQMNNNYGAVK